MWRKQTAICITLIAMTLCAGAQNLSLVKDINPSTDESVLMMNSFDVLNGVVYFNGNDGSGNKLWRTDGTPSGTYMLKDVIIEPGWPLMRAYNGKLYFEGNDPSDGLDPWVSDGTAAGTFRLNYYRVNVKKQISKTMWNFCGMGGYVYFIYCIVNANSTPLQSSYEIWKTDGTSAGTNLVYPFYWIDYMRTGSDRIYVYGNDGNTGVEPWITDGTTAGTTLIKDLCPGLGHCDVYYTPTTGLLNHLYQGKDYPVVDNGVWYDARYDGNDGMELWRSDGTANGTMRLSDINPGGGNAYPNFLVVMNNTLYFAADDGTNGMELWKYPLPNGPVTLVKDIATGSAGSEPVWLTPVNGILYFSAWTNDGGRELWKSDGTAAGTVQVKDIATGSTSSNPNYDRLQQFYDPDRDDWRMFTVMDGKVFFAADDGNGYELWESDGTAAGTKMTADVNPNTGEGSSPRYITTVGSQLMFYAYHPNYGNEWWKYGTTSNQPPVAVASAAPTSGNVALTVSFSSSGSYDPDGTITGWYWDFGDNTTSTDPNPTHIYQYPGTFTAQLTVTDNGSASASDAVTITASGTSGYVYVADQTITRAMKPGGKWYASDVVLIKDNGGQPVGGAAVSATYSGPTSGSASGTTNASGEVTFETTWSRTPGSLEWCFTVTDVQATGKTYNPTANVVTTLCESLPKTGMPPPRHGEPSAASCRLHPVAPNPFSTESMIRFSLPDARRVTLRLYDMLGRAVATVTEGRYAEGTHMLRLDRGTLPAGMYVLQLNTGTEVRQQMICIR